jgi:peptidoglycan/xylan/chitin deacetylase (PgdA/CDA1 family)
MRKKGSIILSFIVLLSIFLAGILSYCKESQNLSQTYAFEHGAIIRGDITKKELALVFTGGDFSDGGEHIRKVLLKKNIKSSFFFTGDYYRNSSNHETISQFAQDGHYLGPHSDRHLLYCSWEDREKLLVTKKKFISDIKDNYKEMNFFGIKRQDALYFLPPYEWYNRKIAQWTEEIGLTLINFTPGTLSNSDYTTPEMANYKTSKMIYKSILDHERSDPNGLNGFILLIHIGTHPDRKDKFYYYLGDLVDYLKAKGYKILRIDTLLGL